MLDLHEGVAELFLEAQQLEIDMVRARAVTYYAWRYDALRQSQREYYQRNKKKRQATGNAWRDKNRVAVNARARALYAQNKSTINARRRARDAAARAKCQA